MYIVLTSLLEGEIWCSDQECTFPGAMEDLMNVSPLCLLNCAEGWDAILNLTLAAGSMNFREADRIPSVCALAESQHWLAPGFWE